MTISTSDTQSKPNDHSSSKKDDELEKDQAESTTEPSGAEDPGSEVEFMRDSDHMKDKK